MEEEADDAAGHRAVDANELEAWPTVPRGNVLTAIVIPP
jgi:hypothetical protein